MEEEEASPQWAELKSLDASQSESPHWEGSQESTALRISYIPKPRFQQKPQFFISWITSLTSQFALISLTSISGLLAQRVNINCW